MRIMWNRFATTLGLVLCFCHLVHRAAADDKPGRNIWDGVYTAAQADRGQSIYDRSCMGCHGEDLTKLGNVLRGAKFMNEWRGGQPKNPFRAIKIILPPNGAPKLGDNE